MLEEDGRRRKRVLRGEGRGELTQKRFSIGSSAGASSS